MTVIAGRCDRVAALCVLVLVACSRGAAPPEPAPTPDPVVAPRDAPPPAPPRDAPPPAPSVAAPQPECWAFADASGRAHEVCITIADAGRPLDEMTTSESGRIVVTRDGTLVADRAYTSVFEDGAAGSIYSTYRTETGEPALVVRRTGDCPDKCVREARVPTDRGELVVMRECDVSCGD